MDEWFGSWIITKGWGGARAPFREAAEDHRPQVSGGFFHCSGCVMGEGRGCARFSTMQAWTRTKGCRRLLLQRSGRSSSGAKHTPQQNAEKPQFNTRERTAAFHSHISVGNRRNPRTTSLSIFTLSGTFKTRNKRTVHPGKRMTPGGSGLTCTLPRLLPLCMCSDGWWSDNESGPGPSGPAHRKLRYRKFSSEGARRFV